MKEPYYKAMYMIFAGLTAVGGVLRFTLKFAFTDHSTGFYTIRGAAPLFYSAVLFLGLGGMLVLNRFRSPGRDHMLAGGRGPILPVFAMISGVSLFLYMLYGLSDPLEPLAPIINTGFADTLRMVNVTAGYISAAALIVTGIGLFFGRRPPGILLAVPPVWQVVLLLSRFNGYHSIFHIADHMLVVLFMLCATLFYMGHARVVCGQGRKDGRNYIISSGLCTAACGLLLVLPNYLYMLIYAAPSPAALISLYESLYVLALSIYALVFTIGYTRSLGSV
ncbi:MAG: hypothetical protein FWH02_02475 [Oscillospiraceae bacterium]|nr:hypothetical protein [Oscillospiraceae bacterium]